MEGPKLKKYFQTAIIPFFLLASPVSAHEFWLGPLDYTLEPGQKMQVEIRIGQDFKGNEFSFNPNQFFDYSLTDFTGKTAIDGRLGDMPSVEMVPPNEGLIVLNHFSTAMLLNYKDDGKFEGFLDSAGLDWVLEKHIERGLPLFGFGEAYTRFAKSLVAVGTGVGSDVATGMPLELVALANPYTDEIANGLPVRLLWHGVGLPNIKIKVFHRLPDGETVEQSYVTTNRSGLVSIPNNGPGDYLISGVHMIQPTQEDTERTGAEWHSLWASMTYAISE